MAMTIGIFAATVLCATIRTHAAEIALSLQAGDQPVQRQEITFDDAKTRAAMQKAPWTVALRSSASHAVSGGDLAAKLKAGAVPPNELASIAAYKSQAVSLLNALPTLGGNPVFFLVSDDAFPAFVVPYNGKKLIALLTTSGNIYNSLLTSPRQRAAQVVASICLPTVSVFSKSLADTDIAYYALFVAYGTKNFATSEGIYVESVALVTPAADAAAFAASKITDQDLIDRSYVLLAESGVWEYQRIKPTLR